MTTHELIMLSAIDYALGRMTYMVEVTTSYVKEYLENGEPSEQFLRVAVNRIISHEKTDNLGGEMDKEKWLWFKSLLLYYLER